MDDGYWPCFSTNKSSSTHAKWGYVGEGFIKELDFSQLWFRLNEADEGSKEDIIGEWKCDAKKFLENALVCIFCDMSTYVYKILLPGCSPNYHSDPR